MRVFPRMMEATNHNQRRAVLLVNLGSPESPTFKATAKFLRQFLTDKQVINLPKIFWWPLLFGFVLPWRSKKASTLYQKIWTSEGSPLVVITNRLAQAIEKALIAEFNEYFPVFAAMTYGEPSLQSAIVKINELEINQLIILPLYPQYSSTTTGAVYNSMTKLFAKINNKRYIPSINFISHYCKEEIYLVSLAESIKQYVKQYGVQWGTQNRLLFSFHGLPKRNIKLGDPYYNECLYTAESVAKILKLPENSWKIAFQSRFGWSEWLTPSIEDQLRLWIDEGIREVFVVAPSFAIDCLETKEEIEIRIRDFFFKLGGKQFNYIPALNDTQLQIDMLLTLIRKKI